MSACPQAVLEILQHPRWAANDGLKGEFTMANITIFINVVIAFSISIISTMNALSACDEKLKTTGSNPSSIKEHFDCKNLLNNENVKKAMIKCRLEAMNGDSETEYGFAVLKKADCYTTLFSHNDNHFRSAKIIVLPETVALFHTH